MNRRLVILLLLTLLPSLSFAQWNVEIAGTAANADGKRIELYGYTDMLTQCEELLDGTAIDREKGFTLRCYITYPRLVFLQVENYSQSFYIEPGRRYEVYIPRFDWDLDEKRNIFLEPEALPVQFLNVGENELNLKIGRIEATVDSCLLLHRVWLDRRYHPQRAYFDTLAAAVNAAVPDGDNVFLNRYKEYRLAEMRLAMRFDSRKRLIGKYIDNAPVRYHDENYMRFFFALYEHSLSSGTKRIPFDRMRAWVAAGDLQSYVDSVGLDPLLKNEQVRELAVLQAMKESFYDKRYPREGVKKMVRKLGSSTKFAEHRELARRLQDSFAKMEKGETVPTFELPDVNKKMVSLESFKGKWVYLSFVRVGDPNSLKEIETLAFFRDTIYSKNKDVVFVSVVCDREFQKMYHFLKNNRKAARYNWTWLHFDGNYKLLERYGVTSYPTFLLINPDGGLQYDFTPPPASGILLHGPWEKREVPDAGGEYLFR